MIRPARDPRSLRPTSLVPPGARSRRAGAIALAIVVVVLASSVVPFAGPAGATAGTGTVRAAPAASPSDAPLRGVVGGHAPATAHAWACQGLRTFGTAVCGASPHAAAANVTGWADAGPNPPPQATNDFYLVEDISDEYVLLFGTTSSSPSDPAGVDMWAYANRTWTALPVPSPAPYPCPGSEIAYDTADGYVLYLGGSTFAYGIPCPSANQTWSYHAGVWTREYPTTSPSGIVLGAMSDDPADGYVLLFGGEGTTACARGGYCGNTWAYSAGNWTNLSLTAAPSARAESGMAYDAWDGYVVLFGGLNTSGAQNDTWKFSGGAWTQLHPKAAPPTPQPDAFSYDARDQAVVYTTARNFTLGNSSESSGYPEIAWTYAAGNWTAINSTPAPPQRLDGQMANDPTTGNPVFFGGLGGPYGTVALDDSWTLHAGTWTNVTTPAPSSRINAPMAYDPDTRSILLVGGLLSQTGPGANDTWSYANGSWTRLTPSRSPAVASVAGLCWDASDGYMLLTGTSPTNGSLETWEYAGGTWSQVTPATQPNAIIAFYDAADGYVVAFGGPYGALQTWSYHAGVWTNRTSTAGTPPANSAATPMVYDSTDGEGVQFGVDYPGSGSVPSRIAPYTYTFKGGSWHNATVANATAPPGLYWASASDDAADGGALFWGGDIGAGGSDVNNVTWLFANGTWAPLGAASHPSPRVGMNGAYDSATDQVVFFGGGAALASSPCGYQLTYCGDTWLWGGHVSPVPVIESFGVTPTEFDLGEVMTLNVTAGGGTPPWSYSYLGLPSGCGTVNLSEFNCTPTTPGTYSIEAIVTDARGQSASATMTVTVRTDVVVATFAAVPSAVPLGNTTTLETTASYGSGTYTYTYLGLPPGCASQDVPALPCSPSVAGNFTPTVSVSDGVGPSATRTATLSVAAVGGHGAPLVSAFDVTPAAIVLGNVTNLSVSATGATPLSYAYTGLPAGCTSSNASAFNCTPTAAGTFSLQVTVEDAHHNTTRVTTGLTVFPVGGGAGLAVSAFGAVPGTLAVNTTTFLQVVASGGRGPLSYAYVGLPPGCASINTSTLPCAPTRTGSYGVSALVSDAAGDHAGVRAILEVIAGGAVLPEVSAFVATPSRVTVNDTLTLFVAVGGGSLPFRYAFTGLPPGCASVDGPVLVCSPTSPGNFSVGVNVTDADGHLAQATTAVEVLAAPTPSRAASVGGTPAWLGVLSDGAAALVGVALVAALAAGWDRQRRRRAGADLVARLDADGAAEPPSGP